MIKEKNSGVNIIGIVMIAYSILCLFLWKNDLPAIFTIFNPLVAIFYFGLSSHSLDGVIYIIGGVFVLIRKEWARKTVLVSSIVFLLGHAFVALGYLLDPSKLLPRNFFQSGPISREPEILTSFIQMHNYNINYAIIFEFGIIFIPLLMYCLFIYYFTRQKIKEQFK